VLASAYLDSAELRQASATLDEALSVATETRALYFFPEALRTKGKLLLLQDPDYPEAAQKYSQQAVTMAREQGARSFELRASISLARLWRDQRKHTEARDLLAPIYGWFTEGFDTCDLKDAKAAARGAGIVQQRLPQMARLYGPAVRCKLNLIDQEITGLAHLYSAR
jgi:predicted ATPase